MPLKRPSTRRIIVGTKVEHSRNRLRYSPEELNEFKRKVTGQFPTKVVLTEDELRIIKEQGEKRVRELQASVTHPNVDQSYAVPTYNYKTGERRLVVTKAPNPVYYDKHPKTVLKASTYRNLSTLFCVLLILLCFFQLIFWIYTEYYYPMEFFREMFGTNNSFLQRHIIEFTFNAVVFLVALIYAYFGLCANTMILWPPFVALYFTWSVPISFVFLFCLSVHIFNFSQMDTTVLRGVLFKALWQYRYTKGDIKEATAWDQAQYYLQCCGVHGYKDWYVDYGQWLGKNDKPEEHEWQYNDVPESCCRYYTKPHGDGFTPRTRAYAIRMLYCQYFPTENRPGCFDKLVVLFQQFTRNVVTILILQIVLILMGAWFAFLSYRHYKRKSKEDGNYIYTLKDFCIDLIFLRAFKNYPDSKKKRVVAETYNLIYDDQPMDLRILEQMRPRGVEDYPFRYHHKQEDEFEAEKDEEARLKVLPIIKDPIIEVEEVVESPRRSTVRKSKVVPGTTKKNSDDPRIIIGGGKKKRKETNEKEERK